MQHFQFLEIIVIQKFMFFLFLKLVNLLLWTIAFKLSISLNILGVFDITIAKIIEQKNVVSVVKNEFAYSVNVLASSRKYNNVNIE